MTKLTDMVDRLRGGDSASLSEPPVKLSVTRALRQIPTPKKSPQLTIDENIANAIAVLDRTRPALSLVRAHLCSLGETAIAASTEDDLALRALMAEDYEDKLDQIPTILSEYGSESLVLLDPNAKPFKIKLSTEREYAIAPFAITNAPHGLNLIPPRTGFSTHVEVADTLAQLNTTLRRLDRAVSTYKRDRIYLATRILRTETSEDQNRTSHHD